jgi:hypothetical protein
LGLGAANPYSALYHPRVSCLQVVVRRHGRAYRLPTMLLHPFCFISTPFFFLSLSVLKRMSIFRLKHA